MGLATHGVVLRFGRVVAQEGLCEAAPGHYQLLYHHKSNIQYMHRVVTDES